MTWIERQLGDFLELKHGFPFEGTYFTGSGVLIVLTPGNCHESGGFRAKGEKEKFYDGPVPDGFLLDEGEMLIVMTDLISHAPVLGGAFLVPSSNKFLHNQRLGLVQITRPDMIDRGFLYYLLNAPSYRAQVRASASGSTVRHTSPGRVKACRVTIPEDIRLQSKIAGILSAYDNLIENNRQRIALLEDAARMLYREWFVYFRFPGHEHARIADGIPEGFELRRLGDVVLTNADSYAARELPEVITYVDIASVTRGRIVSRTRMTAAEAPGRARRKASDGDVIWSNVRPNLRAYALVLDPQESDVFSTGFTVLTPRNVPFSWLYLCVTTDTFIGHLVNHATGAGYPAVRPADFEGAAVLVPPARLLDLFHEATEASFRLISKLNVQCEKLAQARDLLLPRLMKGEIVV